MLDGGKVAGMSGGGNVAWWECGGNVKWWDHVCMCVVWEC